MSLSSEKGQSMTEYAAVLGLIAVVAAAAFTALGGTILGLVQRAVDVIP